MHCVSAYPVPRGSENLRAIATLGSTFRLPVGLSDHGDDGFAAPLAVALGASLYERHVVLEHGDGSVDDAVSSTPQELAALIAAGSRALASLGTGIKRCEPAEAPNLVPSRRALCAARALPAGAIVGAGDVVALRPGIGLAPIRIADLVGVRLARAIEAGAPFTDDDIAEEARLHRDVA
jgi:sialic acid synthase SpsE